MADENKEVKEKTFVEDTPNVNIEDGIDAIDDHEQTKIKLPKYRWKAGHGPLDWLVKKFF